MCIPSEIVQMKCIDEKLVDTQTPTQTCRYPEQTLHASGGLRWINLKVAGWLSTVTATASALNCDGNLLLSRM